MLENDIEEKLRKAAAGIGCIVLKFVAPGNRGVPDRIIVTPDGRVYFVELKRPHGGRLSPLQRYHHDRLRSNHANVRVIFNEAEVMAFITELSNREAKAKVTP